MPDANSSCSECGATYRGQLSICPNCQAEIAADLPEIRVGQVIGGKYEILSHLGVGGMGEVFKARHFHLHAFRAIKVMRRGLLKDEVSRSRFIREAQNATRVQHRNLAVLHDFDKLPDGTYYMVFEFIEGITVRQWGRQHGTVPFRLALDVAVQVLAGLDAIHRANLLHRDISADNVMITADSPTEPVAKIIDLGVAKVVSGEVADSRTQAGIFVGNPRYASPEQLGALADGEEVDARADLYCLGVVLYEMLAGVPPFASRTPQGYAAKHLTELPPPFEVTNSSVHLPPGLEEIVMKALEKDRRKRWSSAQEFAQAISPYISEEVSPSVQMSLGGLLSGVSAARGLHPATELPQRMDNVELPLTALQQSPAPIPGTFVAPHRSADGPPQGDGAGHRLVFRPFPEVVNLPPKSGIVAERPIDRVAPLSDKRVAGRRGVWFALILVAVVVGVVGILWLRPGRGTRSTPVTASATQAALARPQVSGDKDHAVPGFVALNAFPWGEVEAIREVPSGRAVELTERVLTPARLELGPGRYEISLSNPRFPGRVLTVDVAAGEAVTLMVQFADPATASLPRLSGRTP